MAATREVHVNGIEEVLYVAFDLGDDSWEMAVTVGLGKDPRMVSMVAGDWRRVIEEFGRAKRRFGLSDEATVRSCFEAGRDGFWLHRCLTAHGVENVIVDSSSIEVNRRQRRAKTDRIDGRKLVNLLIRFHLGESTVFGRVRVPTPQEEADRHLHRSLKTWTEDETRLINRIRGSLATIGVSVEPNKYFPERLKETRQWNGEPVPAELRDRLLGDFAVLQSVRQQMRQAKARQRQAVRNEDAATKQVRALLGLNGVGLTSAWILAKEFFAWRSFRNRREVGSLAGLAPTPHQSGSLKHEQGISRAGNRWVRGIIVELAWCWIRHQPDSELADWYRRRFAGGNSRVRKTGIVAVARKLLVALWTYLETGVPPAGALTVDWRAKILKRRRVLCEVQ